MPATVTFLFTDIEGSTERWERVPVTMHAAIERHDILLRSVVAECGGEVFKAVGDALHAAFPSPVAGLRAAWAGQRAVMGEDWGEVAPLRVRMALYTGEAETAHGDWLGRPLNRCARLLAAASGGQVLVCETTAALVGDQLEEGVSLLDLGTHLLRGVSRPERVLQLVAPGLPRDFPPLAPVAAAPERPRVPVPPALVPDEDAVFVGRRAEKARLVQAWERAGAGTRQVVFVCGEPGIGKTSLTRHLASRVAAGNGLVLYGRCDEGPGVPYQPFVEALRWYFDACTSAQLQALLGPLGGELARLVPTLPSRLPGLAEPLVAEPETERYRLFEAVSGLLTTVSAQAPLLLVLEDLHWAGPPTLRLLRHVLRSSYQARLLVVATYRDTEVGTAEGLAQVLADLRREPGVERLALGCLGPDDGTELVAARAGKDSGEADVHLASALHAQTGGNPFFLVELLRYLEDIGAAGVDGGRLGGNVLRVLGVPEGAREVIRRRLARLSPAANQALSVASVVGQWFSLGVLRRVPDAGERPDTLLDALDEAVATRVIAETPGRPGDYAFVHALVRQVIYDELSSALRGHLHLRVGEVLEASAATDQGHLGALAHHFAQGARAGTVDKAARYALQAGRLAADQLAHEEAVALFGRGILVLELEYPPDAARRFDLLLALADAHKRAGDVAESKEAALQAAADARSLGSPERLAQAAALYASFGIVGRRDPAAVGLCQEALAALGPDHQALRALVLSRLAFHEAFGEGRDVAGALAQEALDLAREAGGAQVVEPALFVRAITLVGSEDVDARLDLAEELLELARQTGDIRVHARGVRVRALGRLELADLAGFDEDVARLQQLGADLNHWLYRCEAAQWRALRALVDGRLDEVDGLVEEMLVHGGRDENYVNASIGQRFFLRREQGRLGEVRELVATTVAANPGLVVFRAVLAIAHAETGDLEEARRQLAFASADGFDGVPRDFTWTTSLSLLAEICATLHEPGPAATIYDLLRPHRGHLVVVGWGVVCSGAVDRYLGMLAATLGQWPAAQAHFESALALEQAIGSRPLAARTATAYARMLLARHGPGDLHRATELLADARATADSVGLGGVAAEVRALTVDLTDGSSRRARALNGRPT